MGSLDALPSLIGADDAPATVAIPAGDLDGDGRGDLVVGSPYDDTAASAAGAVFVVYEVAGLDRYVPLADAGARLTGERSQDHLGFSAAALGDADGDGRDDVIAGAPDASGAELVNGRVYVLYGGERVASGPVAPWFAFEGGDNHARLGFRVFGPGDTDGDGLADALLGAPAPSPSGALDPGWLALVRGVPGGWAPTTVQVRSDQTTSETTADAGFILREVATLFGRAAVTVDGDDGLPDLIVAAPGVDPEEEELEHSGGTLFTFDLPTAGTGLVITEDDALSVLTGEREDALAWALAVDVSGRVAASTPQRDAATGAVWFVDPADGLVLAGEGSGPGDLYGHALAPADGVVDGGLIIGIPGAGLPEGDGSGAAGRVDVRAADGSITSLDGCWPMGNAGEFAAWGPGPDPSGRDRGWAAITAPGASVEADGDGLVYLLTADELAAASGATCGEVEPFVPPVDQDGDGVVVGEDCDDTDPARRPGATEACGDGVDDDCDGTDVACADGGGSCATASGGSVGVGLAAGLAGLLSSRTRRRGHG